MVPPLFVDNIEKIIYMEIKSKYNVGDTLYTIEDMKVLKFEVYAVSSFWSKHVNGVSYHRSDSFSSYAEEKCFKSETELINHLMGRDGENNKD